MAQANLPRRVLEDGGAALISARGGSFKAFKEAREREYIELLVRGCG